MDCLSAAGRPMPYPRIPVAQPDVWPRPPVGRSRTRSNRGGVVVPRSIAHQTVDELGGPGSVLVRQRDDHIELDRLLTELDGTTGTAQEEVLTRIDRLVFSHAFEIGRAHV